MKSCIKCGALKNFDEFYKQPSSSSGLMGRCKPCVKEDARRNRLENLERARAYDRARTHIPHRVEARANYLRTEAGKQASNKAKAKYIQRHPEKTAARYAVSNAIRDGKIKPWPICAIPDCTGKPEAHHADYSRPLDVVWLCDKHHKAAHNLYRAILRAEQAGAGRNQSKIGNDIHGRIGP